MKKLLLLTAGAFATVLSSAMIMKMYYPDGTTQRFNIDDVNKVSYEGNASGRKMVVEYASQADTLPVTFGQVADQTFTHIRYPGQLAYLLDGIFLAGSRDMF